MRNRSAAVLTFALAMAFLGCAAPRARAQFLGFVGIQSANVRVFTGISTAQVSSVGTIPNVGQASHWLMYCAATGGVNSIQIQLEGSWDGTNFTRISPVGRIQPGSCVSGSGLTLQASGYFPVLRVNVLSITVTAGTLNVFYSGVASPMAAPGLQNNSQGTAIYGNTISLGRAFVASTSATNPGASAQLFSMAYGAGNSVGAYLDKLVVSSTVAFTLNLTEIQSGNLSGGSQVTFRSVSQGLLDGTQATSNVNIQNGSSTRPTTGLVAQFPIPANTLVTIDLSGYAVTASGGGYEFVNVGAVTGTITMNLQWLEQ